MNTILIVTRCCRHENLKQLHTSITSIFSSLTDANYHWMVILEEFRGVQFPPEILSEIESLPHTSLHTANSGTAWDFGCRLARLAVDVYEPESEEYSSDPYIYLLDDDNLMSSEISSYLGKMQADLEVYSQDGENSMIFKSSGTYVTETIPEDISTLLCKSLDHGQMFIKRSVVHELGNFRGGKFIAMDIADRLIRETTTKTINIESAVLTCHNAIPSEFRMNNTFGNPVNIDDITYPEPPTPYKLTPAIKFN